MNFFAAGVCFASAVYYAFDGKAWAVLINTSLAAANLYLALKGG